MTGVQELLPITGVSAACAVLRLPRSTYYRNQRPKSPRYSHPRKPNPRRYSDAERSAMRDVLNSERFMDTSPEQVSAILLEEGTYLASARTLYRVLAEVQQVRERRNRRTHPAHVKPELVATEPVQLWSWDITQLKGPTKGVSFFLYVMLDLFSRFVVGWLLAQRQNAELAQQFIRETTRKHGIEPGQLTLHQDRGSPMRAKSTRLLLDDLGVAASYNRPRVSNDNPYSESHFGTLKARPELPTRFGGVQHGRQVLQPLFQWYNHDHRHSGIAMLTPAQVHYGKAEEALERRHQVRLAAYNAHPERFINGPPTLEQLPKEVWINPPDDPAQVVLCGSIDSEEPSPYKQLARPCQATGEDFALGDEQTASVPLRQPGPEGQDISASEFSALMPEGGH